MKLLYPRCCVLDVQHRLVVACLRLQDVDGPAHQEVRTFGREGSDVVVLSSWLAGHGVTHVAAQPSVGSWKPLYETLQQTFTVLLIDPAHARSVKDVQRLADLLAYGLVQAQVITPADLPEVTRMSRRRRLAMVAALCIMLLTIYGVWMTGGLVDSLPLVSSPPPSVRWQQLQMDYQHPAEEPFAVSLPTLERKPKGVPVEVMLESASPEASWLQLDRERLQLQGTAPLSTAGQTYQLMVRARAEDGSESRLQVALSVTGQTRPAPPAADDSPLPLPRSSAPQKPGGPPDADGKVRIWHSW